jgi:hypothetical protein
MTYEMGYVVRNGKSRYEQIPNTIVEYARKYRRILCQANITTDSLLRLQNKTTEIPGKSSL